MAQVAANSVQLARYKPQRLQRLLPHVGAAILFPGMVVAISISGLSGGTDKAAAARLLGGVLLLAVGPSLWIRSYGAWRPPLTVFGGIIAIATASGVPGLFSHPFDMALPGLMFFGMLALRNYLCFCALPRSWWICNSHFENTLVGWLLVASAVVILGALVSASIAGVSLVSGVRLDENNSWLNANSIGVYTATGILAASMAKFVSPFVRVPFVCAGLYVLLLTQSRTSMVALAIALLVNWIVLHHYDWARAAMIVFVAGCLLYVLSPVVVEEVAGIGQVRALLDRTESDPFSGRVTIFQTALTRFEDSPVFGYGYMSEQSRLDNGYLSLALESGLIGLGASLSLIAMILNRAARLFRDARRPDFHNLARYTICVTAFMLAHAMGERSHPFQIAFTASNAWAVLAGLVFVHSSHANRRPAPELTEPATVRTAWTS